MYGRRASQLLRELACSEKGQLTAFNSDTFDQVIKECNEHNLQLQSLIRKIEDQNLDIQTTRNEDHFGAVIHHLSLVRNKRCLMAYMYNRAEIIQCLRWKVGPILPQEIHEKLSYSEEEYFKNHSAAIESYMSELDLDLTVDMVPPKDPYIRVRVLDDIGDVCLGDHTISLIKNSVHFLRCTDAEQFISQGATGLDVGCQKDVWAFRGEMLSVLLKGEGAGWPSLHPMCCTQQHELGRYNSSFPLGLIRCTVSALT